MYIQSLIDIRRLKDISEQMVAMKDDRGMANDAQLLLNLVLQDALEDDPTGLHYASKKGSAVEASIQRMNRLQDGSCPFATMSETSSSGIVVGTVLQGTYETAQAASSCVQSLGRALQSLEQVVKVVDGLANVSTSWNSITLIFDSCCFRFILFVKSLGCFCRLSTR